MAESHDHLISKETSNYLRWDKMIDAVDDKGRSSQMKFEVYVPKWRVPESCPETIYVKMEKIQELPKIPELHLTGETVTSDPILKNTMMICYCQITPESSIRKDSTIKYQRIKGWGEWDPYIPYSLTFNAAKYLKLTIMWGKTEQVEHQNLETIGYLAIKRSYGKDK